MLTRLLTESEFEETCATPMRAVRTAGEVSVDIWPYVDAIPAEDLQGMSFDASRAAHVYRNGRETFDHVLFAAGVRNVFVVVVVDLNKQSVMGHHVLNLNEKYGLPTPDAPFASPSELATFLSETAEVMTGHGMSAESLLDIGATAYTTSSEWLGEVGAAVRGIEASSDVPTDVQQRLDRIMVAVHVAWPTM